MPNIYPGARTWLGLSKETTAGTAVLPTLALPFDKFDPTDSPTWLDDTNYRGSMGSEYGMIQGPLQATADLSGNVYADSICDLLYNVFGDYKYTLGASAPNSHQFALLNSGTGQPPTHTFTDVQNITPTVGARVYSYGCVSELGITGNAQQLLTYDAKITSFASTPAASAPTLALGTEPAQPAWRSTIGIGGPATGGTLVKNVSEWAITFTRDLQVYNTANGSQQPFVIARGALTATGTLNFSPAVDETALAYMLNNTQPQLQIVVDNGGTTTADRNITIDIAKCAFESAPPSRDTTMGFNVSFKTIMNTTNVISGGSGGLSPATVTVMNARTTL